MAEKKKVKKNLSKEAIQKKKAVPKTSKKQTKAATKESKTTPKVSKPKEETKVVVKKATPKQNKDYTTPIGIIIAVVAVILLAVFLLKPSNDMTSDNSQDTVNKLLVTVNGEEITQEDIDFIYSRIPEQNKAAYTQETLLDQLITEKLLTQKANEKGIIASEEEIQEFIDLIITSNQITEEILVQRLGEQSLTLDDLKKEVEKQIILTKLVNEEVEVENLTDAELKAFYDANMEQFVQVPESVNASHILVCFDESLMGCDINRTKKEAEIKALEIEDMITKDNFAEVAIEYSEGPSAPNGGNLGFFTKGQMVPEFETVAFNMEVGEVSEPVFTEFGYHIIKVFGKTEESIVPFEEIKDTIQLQLQSQVRQDKFQEYVEKLKAESNIVMA